MKRKKLAAVLLIGAMGTSLIFGCGKGKVTADDIQDTEVTEDDLEADLAEEGDIMIGEDSADGSTKEDAADADGTDEVSGEEADEDMEVEAVGKDVHTDEDVFDENGDVTFTFEAKKADLGEKPATAEMKESAGDLDNARWEALKIYYDGDETDAKDELEELRESPDITAEALKKIEPYYAKLAPYLQQAGITNYDMKRPFYEDEEEVDYDMYTDGFTTYYLTIYFNTDGSIASFDLTEEDTEEEYEEEDDEEDEDDDEEEIGDDDDAEFIELD